MFRAILALAFIFSSSAAGPAMPLRNQLAASLEIEAPGQVAVGDLIEVTLRLTDAADIGGYETAVLFDTAAAEFAGLQQRQNDVAKIGRDIASLAAVDLPNGAAIGLYSCPRDDCLSRQPATTIQVQGAQGTVELARLYLVANLPGALELKLDAAKFVDAAGNPVTVEIPRSSVIVQVGAIGAGPSYAAPAAMWTLQPAGQALAEDPTLTQPHLFDLTGDGLVTNADAMEVSIEWEVLRLRQAACGDLPDPTRDVNRDGCIDVADLQLVAAHIGAASVLPPRVYLPFIGLNTTPQQPQPANGTTVAQTFTVNSTSDAPDSNIGNGVCKTASLVCSLRAAIQEANAHTGPDTIAFNIPGSGVQTIRLTRQLPTLNDASGPTTIDGYTQPGASPNTDVYVSNAVILVQIEGGGEKNFDGFVITSAGNTVRGLAIYRMRRAFWIKGRGASNNYITGSFVGTNAAGTYSATVGGGYSHGLHIEQGASYNHIGGPTAAERNVISGNGSQGVGLWHEGSDGNVALNNLVGLNPAGTSRLPNLKHGIDINYGSSSNVCQANVVSGNNGSGIEISHTSATQDNQIIGNYVGTNVTGTSAPPGFGNRSAGINIHDGPSYNVIADNVVGNNSAGGIVIEWGEASTHNVIHDNRVGISLTGSPIPNQNYGIRINNGHNNVIGPGNIIAFNITAGILIAVDASDFNTLTRNSIYSNGSLGIELFPSGVNPNDADDTDTGPNEQLNYPVLEAATPTQVSGTACAGCTVEIFIADSGAGAYGEGKIFVGSATADGSGAFTADISGAVAGNYLTSTATDSAGNTSEFSLNFLISVPQKATLAQD